MSMVRFHKLSALVTFLVLLPAVPASAKDKAAPADVVDSGTFGVYTAGHRIATETFAIKQGPDGSVVSSVFKSAQGEQQAEQSSELQLTPSVDLRKYEWKEVSPEKTAATVMPNDNFLIEQFAGADSKQHNQNFLLPPSTSILDDYFFVHREVLAWKYLATSCKNENGTMKCPTQPVQFGTLNPRERTSMSVSIEFAGRDKFTFHGTEQEFPKFRLKSEMGDWAFWLNDKDKFKLLRLIDDSGTEVLRD